MSLTDDDKQFLAYLTAWMADQIETTILQEVARVEGYPFEQAEFIRKTARNLCETYKETNEKNSIVRDRGVPPPPPSDDDC